MEKVTLDYGYAMSEVVGESHGITPDGLGEMAGPVARVHHGIVKGYQERALGFMELPGQDEADLAPILEQAERLKCLADTLVVLGIGGSALGTTAVDMALAGANRHAFPPAVGKRRVFVADNSDPRAFARLLNGLDFSKTVFNVISKSGSTAETMSQYLVVRERLEAQLGPEEAKKRLLFTTDPKAGSLRPLAAREGIATLSVPPNVGGRYSVLTAVGLLPLAFAGHDVKALLAGAAAMAERCQDEDLAANPAYLFGSLAYEFWRMGRNVLVMMPYASDLFGLAQWFGQLWAESLGKAHTLDGDRANVGQTPVAAVGATDQHSQLQLYMEGPQDKLVVFLSVGDYEEKMPIPTAPPDLDALSYLAGRSMAELIAAETRATATALALQGRPSLTIHLPKMDETALGQVIYLLELATVACGGLLNIDPLDQPGVELSKKLTYGLMGRAGYEEQAARIRSLDSGDRFKV